VNETSPYKGLARFDDSELDAQLFFGREREIELVTANLLASRLTVLYGPSGVGKSSLLHAGVVRRLRALVPAGGPGDGDGALAAVVDSWRDDPVAAVAAAAGARQPEAHEPLADVLGERVAEVDGELYLVLDQMEEYFVYHGRDGGGPLRDVLGDILRRPELRVHVLLGIRDDALAELDRFKGRVPGLFGNVLRLDHLDVDAGRAAIVEPLATLADLGGPAVVAEPALVAAVVDQVASGRIERRLAGRGVVPGATRRGRIEAPYLQLVMERIWEVERARGSTVLRAETLAELGGAGRIVQDHLERALDGLPEPDRELVSRLFRQLVTPSGTKIAYGVHDLSRYAGEPAERLEDVLQSLSDERVVRAVPGRNGGGPRYEIFHDVLGAAVLEWGARYEAEQALVQERLEARRRNRRFAVIAGCAGVVLAALALLTAYAFDQRSEAQEQAELAAARQADAEREAENARAAEQRAKASAAEAKKQQKAAEQSEDKAEASAEEAQQERDAAEAARDDAEQQKEQAQRSEADAQQQRQVAEQATADANRSKADLQVALGQSQRSEQRAQKEKRDAQNARARERRQREAAVVAKERAQAQTSVARASSRLAVDPEGALGIAIEGARKHRADGLERVLRDALKETRARAILPAGGNSPVSTVATSRDGLLVVVPGGRGARIFEAATGKLVREIDHGAKVQTATFAPDGRSVVTGGDDGFARRWDVRSGQRLAEYRHGAAIREIAFSPDGRFVATAAGEAGRIWDAERGTALATRSQSVSVTSVSFNPAGTLLVVVGVDAQLYEVGTWRPGPLLNPDRPIHVARFAPVGPLIATGGSEHFPTIWNTTDGSRAQVLSRYGAGVQDIAWSPSADRVATAHSDNSGRVWEVGTGDPYAFLGAHSNHVTSLAFSPDGGSIVTTSLDRTAHLWGGNFYARHTELLGHSGSVRDVVYTADGSSVITASDDGSARIWKPWVDPPLAFVAEHDSAVHAVDVNADGTLVVSGDVSGVTRIRRRRSGEVLRALDQPARVAVVDVMFSADGTTILTAAQDGIARLWRVRDGALLRSFDHEAPLRSAAFDADGSRLVTAGADGVARVWNLAGRRLRAIRHGDVIAAAAFSPDGRSLATAGEDRIARVWRLSDGRLIRTLVGHEAALTAIVYSPDGKLIVTSSLDADARIWDVQRPRQPARVLSGHSGVVSDVAFSEDGRWIATAGPITVGLWETRTGQRIDPGIPRLFLRGHGPRVRAVAFGPGGRLVSAGDDRTVRTYACELCGTEEQLLRLARRRLENLGRPLTPTERKRYIGWP
jgi:WD40 repeat protein